LRLDLMQENLPMRVKGVQRGKEWIV
jgi:hypothetical protein